MTLLKLDFTTVNVLLKGEYKTKPLLQELPVKKSTDRDNEMLTLVLHVDDEPDFLESTKKILEMNAPLRVYTATSVDDAIEILKTKKVDVIVSDYEMSVENGLEFLRELRETKSGIPFFLFTGRGREEVAIEALNIGADGYFNKFGKPATVYGQLLHAIFSCVKAKRADDDLLKFKTLSDRTGYGVLLIDLNGNILYLNLLRRCMDTP